MKSGHQSVDGVHYVFCISAEHLPLLRQNYAMGIPFEELDLQFFLQGADLLRDCRLGDKPVSYTHLDVYKRQSLQSIITRRIDPAEAALITVGQFHSGTKNNIVSGKTKFSGIIRTLNLENRSFIKEEIEDVYKRQGYGRISQLHISAGIGFVTGWQTHTEFHSGHIVEPYLVIHLIETPGFDHPGRRLNVDYIAAQLMLKSVFRNTPGAITAHLSQTSICIIKKHLKIAALCWPINHHKACLLYTSFR